jgi:polysaccharide biosynthesis protein PslH
MGTILILTPQLPYPPRQGAGLRNFYIIRGLAGRHRLALLSYYEEDQRDDPEAIGPLLELCTAVNTVPAPQRSQARRLRQLFTSPLPDMAHRLHSTDFEARVRQLLSRQRFDVVQIEGIELAWLIDLIRETSPGSRIVFDNHNAESELQRRAFLTDLPHAGRWPAALYSWLQLGRLRRFERWACRQADAVTAVSEADRRHLEQLAPGLAVSVIPNCIDVWETGQGARQVPSPGYCYDLLLSGKMDYRPNIDAALWFAAEIWPRIRQARPQTTWAIVGQRPHRRLSHLAQSPGITITGQVERVEPYLAGAGVFVMPFRLGSGTRLKLIEAMAVGKAVVSTAAGAEGFAVRHQQELYLADTPSDFATAVLHLLADETERTRLGQAAQAFAQQYDWRQVMPRFDDVYRRILETGRG